MLSKEFFMKRILKKILKAALWVLVVILALVALVIGGLNIAKYAIYKDYYTVKTDICENPGLGDGFVCQGIAASEENGVILVSGYMKNGGASRIYITDTDSVSRYVELKKGEESYTGHAGGIATTGDFVYIASGEKIYTLSLSGLLAAEGGASVDVGEGSEVNNSASFVYTDDAYLYVGEFHDGGKYTITGHENETAEGTHYAICTKYALSDLSTPLAVYSIRDKVQGICFTPDGRVVMSTSYGLTDTVYYVYNLSEATDSGKTFDGAPLYYLDKLSSEMKGPAMGEDLDWYDGRVITLTESASDKYIFGKLFGARKIVGIEF